MKRGERKWREEDSPRTKFKANLRPVADRSKEPGRELNDCFCLYTG